MARPTPVECEGEDLGGKRDGASIRKSSEKGTEV
jgi:hypothetical protein